MGRNKKAEQVGVEARIQEIENANSLLYIGSGTRGNHHCGILELLDIVPLKVAIDINPSKLSSWVGTGWLPLVMDAQDLGFFQTKSFDEVIAFDLIEHLSYGAAAQMLQEIDRICIKEAVIFTPSGFLDTEKYQPEHVKDKYDIHLSGWSKEDLQAFGYNVTVIKDCHKFDDVNFDALLAVKHYEQA
jgi:hypothetical protein